MGLDGIARVDLLCSGFAAEEHPAGRTPATGGDMPGGHPPACGGHPTRPARHSIMAAVLPAPREVVTVRVENRGARAHGLRLAELLAAVSLATDLAHDVAAESALRDARADGRARPRLRAGPTRTSSDAYYLALLYHIGCTGAVAAQSRLGGGDDVNVRHWMSEADYADRPGMTRIAVTKLAPRWGASGWARGMAAFATAGRDMPEAFANIAEVAARLSERLGASPRVTESLCHAYARWDGKVFPLLPSGDGLSRDRAPRASGARRADLPPGRRCRRRGRGGAPAQRDRVRPRAGAGCGCRAVTTSCPRSRKTKVKHELVKDWADSKSDPLQLPSGATPQLALGKGIANLYIPRLGRDYAYTIVQGTSQDDLEKGPGHYPKTVLPGQTGNFAIAGHRVGKGEPFLNLDHLRAGDSVIVETESHYFVYKVLGDQPNNDLSDENTNGVDGIPGREIIDPERRRGALRGARPPARDDADQEAHDDDHLPSEVHRTEADGLPRNSRRDLRQVVRLVPDAGRGHCSLRRDQLMYTWIWRHLPGPLALKLGQVLFLFLAVCALLLFVVFPYLDAHLPISQVTVGGNDG